MYGGHAVKFWSTTQAITAMSSGEAEFYGIVRGSSQGIGFRNLLMDLGVHAQVVICTDASAAKGMASRKGSGKVRHVEVNQLWVQEKVASGDIQLRKVCGFDNHADIFTKSLNQENMLRHMENMGFHVVHGRHNLSPSSIV
jgi:hypothetical protein